MLVHLRFHFVDFKDFKHPNDLYGIHFKDIRVNQWEMADFEISLEVARGLGGSFLSQGG